MADGDGKGAVVGVLVAAGMVAGVGVLVAAGVGEETTVSSAWRYR
jgi:hypothetical protein